MKPIRIIGIDPGLRVTGFGVVEQRHRALQYIASGVIRSGSGTLAERLLKIHLGIIELVREYEPSVAVCEIVFVNVNPKSTLLLGQARGAAIAALASQQLGVHEYTALQVKQSVVGYGRATKAQMQSMMQRMLGLPAEPSPDAADALACAVCHLHFSQVAGAIGAAAQAQSRLIAASGLTGRIRRGRMVG